MARMSKNEKKDRLNPELWFFVIPRTKGEHFSMKFNGKCNFFLNFFVFANYSGIGPEGFVKIFSGVDHL